MQQVDAFSFLHFYAYMSIAAYPPAYTVAPADPAGYPTAGEYIIYMLNGDSYSIYTGLIMHVLYIRHAIILSTESSNTFKSISWKCETFHE